MRTPSISVTELVKEIAREIVKEELDKFAPTQMMRDAAAEFHELTQSIDNSMQERGAIWTREEEELLMAELDASLKYIAKKHKRGVAGIQARIKKIGAL